MLQPLAQCGVECVIHHELVCMKINTHIIYVALTSKRDCCKWSLFCCLLPQCEALCTCTKPLRVSDHNSCI